MLQKINYLFERIEISKLYLDIYCLKQLGIDKITAQREKIKRMEASLEKAQKAYEKEQLSIKMKKLVTLGSKISPAI